jgi:hypothetical protein
MNLDDPLNRYKYYIHEGIGEGICVIHYDVKQREYLPRCCDFDSFRFSPPPVLPDSHRVSDNLPASFV